jgi:glutamate 5-kinase
VPKPKTKKKRRLWVVKAGSQMVITGGPTLIRSWMRQVDTLDRKFGIDVIWVTSGAIATAKQESESRIRKQTGRAQKIGEKQALSALGQPLVMYEYNQALAKIGRLGSQVLLTSDDLGHGKRRTNLLRTLSTLISWGVLPILNENDAVSTEEIQFGDNDHLSALVAGHMMAERLILLTDVDGLFDSDPRKNLDAKLVSNLSTVSSKLLATLSSSSPSGMGTGGMLSKMLAARTARGYNVETHLVKGDLENAMLKVADFSLDEIQVPPGTRIQCKTAKRGHR